MVSDTKLRANPGFRLLLLARTISWAGSAITLVAVPLALYQHTGSATLTALVTAAESLPYLIFGLFAGVYADRWPRRRTMAVTSVLAGLLTAGVPLAAATGLLSTGLLLVVALASATCLVFFDAAGFGLLPALVGRDRIAEATSLSTAVNTAVTMLGPAIGGVLAATLGPLNALLVDAASFLLAALLLSRVPEGAVAPPATATLRADIAEGFRFIWRHRLVRTFTFLGTITSLTGGVVLGLLVATAVRQFGLTAGDARIGLCYTMLGVGTLAAAVVLPRLTRRFPLPVVAAAALGISVLGLTGWSLATGLTAGLISLILWQLGTSVFVLGGITLRQSVTPDALQGRVNTTARMIAWGGQPFGAALGGVLSASLGIRATLLAAAAATVAATLVVALSPTLPASTRSPGGSGS